MDDLLSPFTIVQHTSEDGSNIDSPIDGSLRTGIYNAVAPYRQLYVAQIVRFFSELLRALQYEAMKIGREDIPYFNEGFGCFYNNDKYLRTRRNYEL